MGLNECDTESPDCFRHALKARAKGLRKSERTRLSLMATMAQCLEDTAPSDLTVAVIGRAAGVAHGTFYLHFADIRAALTALLTDFVSFVQQRLHDAGKEPAPDRERRVIAAYYHVFENNRGLMRCLLNHLEAFPEAQTQFQRLNHEWIGTVVHAIERRAPGIWADPNELTRRAYAMGGMVDQYLSALLLTRDRNVIAASGDMDTVIDTLTTLWRKGLSP